MIRRYLAAILFAIVLMVGALAVLHADAPGRCNCTTMGWGVWDWEYWWNGCDQPLPYPECGGT